MSKQKLFIWFLAAWQMFLGICSFSMYQLRINNQKLAGDILFPQDRELIESQINNYQFEFHASNIYLLVMAIIAILSGILLLVKKAWGRALSIVLGCLLLPFGLYLFIYNFSSPLRKDLSFIDRFIEYFRHMGASLTYIDLICIAYGIFAIVFFACVNVNNYIAPRQVPMNNLRNHNN